MRREFIFFPQFPFDMNSFRFIFVEEKDWRKVITSPRAFTHLFFEESGETSGCRRWRRRVAMSRGRHRHS